MTAAVCQLCDTDRNVAWRDVPGAALCWRCFAHRFVEAYEEEEHELTAGCKSEARPRLCGLDPAQEDQGLSTSPLDLRGVPRPPTADRPPGPLPDDGPLRPFQVDVESRVYYCLDRGRRARMIPFEWVRDDNVVTYSSPWYEGPEGFWDHVGREARNYRVTARPASARLEQWCEAAGMGPQLDRVAWDYSVPVFSNGGNNSISAQRQVVDHALGRDVPTVLLHVGDFDPYGESIFTAFVENAQAFLEKDRIVGTQRIEPVGWRSPMTQVKASAFPRSGPGDQPSKFHATIRERWIDR